MSGGRWPNTPGWRTITYGERSANPKPVCRRGGCSLPAEADEEWCAPCLVEIGHRRALGPVDRDGEPAVGIVDSRRR